MKGISKLAQVMTNFTKDVNKNEDQLELGLINGDMSLLLDNFDITIPKGGYLVSRSLTLDDPLTITVEEQGSHKHGSNRVEDGAHLHEVKRPEKLNPLKQGDRVLVAWINNGSDIVVIDVVVNS